MKTGATASAIVGEHTTRMKKQLGSLNSRNLKGTEPIRIGLQDIRNTEKKGKWWLVGASWRNDTENDFMGHKNESIGTKTSNSHNDDVEEGEVDLLQLAREQRMNTDVRRAIFITIMSAADYKDAHMRLLKLNLKKSQEMEIPRIIVHCAGCEKAYNPYYTILARKFCSDHKSRKCFQFALWDLFKTLGEKKDEDADSDEEEGPADTDLSLRKLVNLGKLYGTLIATSGLSITCLKPLSFQYLKSKTRTFIEILLITVILESQKGEKNGRNEKKLLEIFINADAAPEMVAGLQYFLRKVVRKSELTASKAEKETVQWACKAVGDMLTRLMATVTLDED
jgi:nucleolar MIF4G domain-containing protein 1